MVAGNLVEEFLRLGVRAYGMSGTLARWTSFRLAEGGFAVLWLERLGRRMAARRPIPDEALASCVDETWRNLAEADWMEAFRSHPE